MQGKKEKTATPEQLLFGFNSSIMPGDFPPPHAHDARRAHS